MRDITKTRCGGSFRVVLGSSAQVSDGGAQDCRADFALLLW
jgi:hypothetical protein